MGFNQFSPFVSKVGVRNFLMEFMGVRIVFDGIYGGPNFFGVIIWGSEIFGHFSQNVSGWVSGVKNDRPLRKYFPEDLISQILQKIREIHELFSPRKFFLFNKVVPFGGARWRLKEGGAY